MKGTGCIGFILLWISTSFAQDQDKQVLHYIFPEFKNGLVLLKDGNNYSASLNYHSLSEQMIFESEGEKLAIAKTDLPLIDTIFIEDRKFVTFDDRIVELAYDSSWSLFVEHKCKIKDEGKSIGYGQKTKTANVSSYSSYYGGDNLYNLKIAEVYVFAPYKEYWLRMNGELFEFIELYELKKILNKHKAVYKAYLKDHKVKTEDQESLIQLIKHVEEKSHTQF